jgi:hypothetical protein
MSKHKYDDKPVTGMYELLDAIEETIRTSPKREALAEILDAYHRDFPEEFHWAIGAQSPSLLFHLFGSIGVACRSETGAKLRLVDRKPEGNA